MIYFVQVLLNLVDVRYIKCTCKVSDWTSFFGKKMKKIMNSDQTTCRLVLSVFFLYSKRRRFRFELGISPKFKAVLQLSILCNFDLMQLNPCRTSIGILDLHAFCTLVLDFGFMQFNP